MSTIHLCDGCGKPADNPEVVGVIVKREYCSSCAEIAKEFLKAEDQLRIDLTTVFRETRDKMIAIAPLGKLPDVLT